MLFVCLFSNSTLFRTPPKNIVINKRYGKDIDDVGTITVKWQGKNQVTIQEDLTCGSHEIEIKKESNSELIKLKEEFWYC